MISRGCNNISCNPNQVLPRMITTKKAMRYYDNVERPPRPCSLPSMIPTYGKVQMNQANWKSDSFKGRVSGHTSRYRAELTIVFFRVLLDASARRFQAQRIYLRNVAAARWVNMRNGILQGQRRHAGHTAALQQADNALRAVWDHRCLLVSPRSLRDADDPFLIGACHHHRRANCERLPNKGLAGRTLATGRSSLAEPSRLDPQPPMRLFLLRHSFFSFLLSPTTSIFWHFIWRRAFLEDV